MGGCVVIPFSRRSPFLEWGRRGGYVIDLPYVHRSVDWSRGVVDALPPLLFGGGRQSVPRPSGGSLGLAAVLGGGGLQLVPVVQSIRPSCVDFCWWALLAATGVCRPELVFWLIVSILLCSATCGTGLWVALESLLSLVIPVLFAAQSLPLVACFGIMRRRLRPL